MAIINFYDNIFNDITDSIKVYEKTTILSCLEDYIAKNEDKTQLVEIYNADTDETSFQMVSEESYKVLVLVDGQEVPLSYETMNDEIVSVLFVPQNKTALAVVAIVAGVGLALTGVGVGVGLGWFAAGGIKAIGAMGLILGGAALAVHGYSLLQDETKSNYEQDEKDNLPYLSGAENETLLGNRYPFVMGRHLLSPYIAATPYHRTKTKSFAKAEDGGQELHILYCAGYGPLRLTDFKLGEDILAYNRSSGNGDRKTIMNGQLSGCDDPDNDVIGDFPVKWKNNNVKLEILQAGTYIDKLNDVNISNKYGTIYPQVCLEKQIDANSLFVYDKEVETAATVIYYNRAVPIGYRNNTVRFSNSCPMKLEVELDFQNGLFATRQEKSGDTFQNRYYNIPLNLAIQWRFTSRDVEASDAESPNGWKNFDFIHFETIDENGVSLEDNVPPSVYTIQERQAEIDANRGLSSGTTAKQNAGWLGSPVFMLNPEQSYRAITGSDLTEALENGYIETYLIDCGKWVDEPIDVRPGYNHYYKEWQETRFRATSVGAEHGYGVINSGMTPARLTSTATGTSYSQDNFNTTERRYVFTYDFTEEECRKLAGFTGDGTTLDVVEVRVIRISPCYLNESSNPSDNVTAMNYQDLFKWTYLRTYTFDKVKYLEALKNADDPSTVSVQNFKERPEPIDEDMDKFCYIALQAEEDAAGTIGGTIKRFNCIVESFNPKYNATQDKWYPEGVWEEYKYYQKYEENNEIKIKEITKAEYEAGVVVDQINFIKQKKGNDFTQQIRDEVFVMENIVKDKTGKNIVSPMVKYQLPDSMVLKYVSSNTASQFLHAVVGPQLSVDSKTYDCVQMDNMTELYKFCEDVTDGTKENYTGLNAKLVSTIDLFKTNRIHSASDFEEAGYTEFDKVYSSCWPRVWSKKDGSESAVVTMVKNVKSQGIKGVLGKETFEGSAENSYKYKYENNINSFDSSVVLARYTGSNAKVYANRYAKVCEMLACAYFEPNEYKSSDEKLENIKRCFDILRNDHINALRAGVHSDVIKELCINLCERYGEDVDPIYESYIIDVLEQSTQNSHVRACLESDNEVHVKFECNGVVTKEVKLETLVQKILLTGRSTISRSEENKYKALIGRPSPYPVTVLNQRNCISKGNSKSYEDLPSGFSVSCVDEQDNYSTNDFYVMAKGEDYRNPLSRIEQFTLEYVTNKWQLASLARFNLACRLYQLESYTRTVGLLGYAISLGDTVLLQDDSLLIGTDKAGRVQELIEDDSYIYGFVTDEPFYYTGQTNDGLSVQGCTVVQPNKYAASRCVTYRCASPTKIVTVNNRQLQMSVGLTNLVLFEVAVQKDAEQTPNEDVDSEIVVYSPKMDNIVSFGLVGSITIKAVITGIKPSEKDQFTLTLVPYNEELYRSGFSQPVFKSNMTVAPVEANFDFNDNVTKRTIAGEVDNFAGSAISQVKSDLGVGEGPDIYIASAVAKEAGLRLSVSFGDSTNLKNAVQSVVWQILEPKAGAEEAGVPDGYHLIDAFITNLSESEYTFDRNIIGYPEKTIDTEKVSRMDSWKVRAKVKNVYGVEASDWCNLVSIDCDNYGTWKLNPPTVSSRYSDRTITLTCEPGDLGTIQYGTIRYKVRVRRQRVPELDENLYPYDPEGVFFEPDLTSDPYRNIFAYKKVKRVYVADGQTVTEYSADSAIVNSVHLQTMPLWGQDAEGEQMIRNTPYEFEIVAFNEAGESEPVTQTETAYCTSIRDIVYANETVKVQYIKNLTALCSAFGFISEGGSKDDLAELLNYWTLNDDVVTGIDSSGNNIKRKGAFRVGGETQYILSRPVLDTNGQIVDYEIEFKVGNFKLSSTQTEFNTCLYVYDEANSNKRIRISSNGFEIQEKVNGKWSVLAKLNADNKGNLTLTNAPDSDSNLPKMRTLVDLSSVIYHLEQSTLDTNGGNSARFTFTPDEEKPYVDSSLVNEQSYAFNGIIKKTSLTDESICLFNNSDKLRIGNTLVNLDTLEIDDTPNELNQILGTNAFRWEM